ncbi:metallophosphoesterase [Cytobacillus gottheilii]|uniref:metallophosphoesterase n=1 Tax=Cytobacillus gottheilii TaxID=859144 RepID=UPI0009BC14C9|nr:metallophosphoesterase [Cytobacillus gottheilii]
MKRILGFAVFILIYTAIAFYISWNGWVWLHTVFGFQNQWLFAFLSGLLFFSYLIGQSSKRLSLFRMIGSYWFAVLQYALLILPIANISVWLLQISGVRSEDAITWVGFIVFIIFIFLFLYGSYNAYSPVVRTYKVQLNEQIKHFDSLTIAMASDMHFGHLSGLAHARRLVKEINHLQPDLILLPGDIIDDDPAAFIRKNMGDVLKELSAPLGIYGVLGNHEYYGGAIPQFIKEMERVGIRILQDEVLSIKDSFHLVGRKDKTDKQRKSILELTNDLNKDMPIIMMDHQPAEIKKAEEHGVDILLSGHTHRGQMAPNHLITRRIFDLDWGYRQFGKLHAIVSSGYGFWGPPIRIGSRSEVIKIEVSTNNH